MHVVTVVGARPQFVKAAALSRAIAGYGGGIRESLVHTGQHYDYAMSEQFFQQLGLPAPCANLEVGSGSHGAQTGAIMQGLETLLPGLSADIVLVYGDTNSTLAAALTAAKLAIPIAHVEAGLRSYRRGMAEEVNRVVTDSLSDLLFCPTQAAASALRAEGHGDDVHLVGDVMLDVFRSVLTELDGDAERKALGVASHGYALVTIHRAETVDDAACLAAVLQGLTILARRMPVVLPLHPRTRNTMNRMGLAMPAGVQVVDPAPYKGMVALLQAAAVVVTDSGGLQKEALFAGKPCVTIRDETEWSETLEGGWNRLSPPRSEGLVDAVDAALHAVKGPMPDYGGGQAAQRIVDVLARWQGPSS